MAEDRRTTTTDAAAAYERGRSGSPIPDPPDRSEYADLGGPVTRPLTDVEKIHGDLVVFANLPLPPGSRLEPTTGTAVRLTGPHGTGYAARVVAWAEANPDYDVLVRDGDVYLRLR